MTWSKMFGWEKDDWIMRTLYTFQRLGMAWRGFNIRCTMGDMLWLQNRILSRWWKPSWWLIKAMLFAPDIPTGDPQTWRTVELAALGSVIHWVSWSPVADRYCSSLALRNEPLHLNRWPSWLNISPYILPYPNLPSNINHHWSATKR